MEICRSLRDWISSPVFPRDQDFFVPMALQTTSRTLFDWVCIIKFPLPSLFASFDLRLMGDILLCTGRFLVFILT